MLSKLPQLFVLNYILQFSMSLFLQENYRYDVLSFFFISEFQITAIYQSQSWLKSLILLISMKGPLYVYWKEWRFSYFVFVSSKFDKKKLDQNPSVKDVVKWVYGPMIEELLQVSYKPLVRRWCSKRSMELIISVFFLVVRRCSSLHFCNHPYKWAAFSKCPITSFDARLTFITFLIPVVIVSF